MKILCLLALSFYFYFPSQGQTTKDSLVKEAKQYFAKADFTSAYPIFKRIFADTAGVQNYPYYFGIVCAVQVKDNNQAFAWLKNYIEVVKNPQTNFYRLQYKLRDLYKDPRWNSCLALMQKKEEEYANEMHFNIKLKRQLDELFYDDQKYRILLAPFTKIYGDNSPEVNQLWGNIETQDSINLKALIDLRNNYGWLAKKEVGSAAVTQWAIIQHANLSVKKNYLPTLKQAVEAGDITKEQLALTIDRIRIREGKKQIYGSQIGRINWKGKYINFIRRLEDPDDVDKRRGRMEMESIEQYAKRYDIEWDPTLYKTLIDEYEQLQEVKD